MIRDEQLVRLLIPKHLQPDQLRGYDNCMQAISSHRLNLLQHWERITVDADEAAIGTHLFHCAAGFNSANRVALRVALVLNGNRWITKDADLSQSFEGQRRQAKPA